jgi:hypothetical protein
MKSPLGVQVKAFQRGPSNGGASEGANGFIVRNVILEKVYRMCDALITSKPDLPVSRSLFSAFSDPAPSISLSLSLSLSSLPSLLSPSLSPSLLILILTPYLPSTLMACNGVNRIVLMKWLMRATPKPEKP